jgi:protein involved in ribonucleotide reduction
VYSIVYFSNISNNTHRFVEKLDMPAQRIPVRWEGDEPFMAQGEYVLFVPTYGGGNDGYSIPKQVKKFLNIEANRNLLRGVVGFGNTNFGDHYCGAAEMITAKTGVPLLYRVEIMGTPYDVEQVKERLGQLWTTTAITN